MILKLMILGLAFGALMCKAEKFSSPYEDEMPELPSPDDNPGLAKYQKQVEQEATDDASEMLDPNEAEPNIPDPDSDMQQDQQDSIASAELVADTAKRGACFWYHRWLYIAKLHKLYTFTYRCCRLRGGKCKCKFLRRCISHFTGSRWVHVCHVWHHFPWRVYRCTALRG